MSKFNNWADKLFVDMDKEMEKTLESIPEQESVKKREETVEEIEQKLKNMDIGYERLVKKNGFDSKKHYMYSTIRNKLLKQLTEAKVKSYDVAKTKENPKYVSYKESLKNEVSKEDKNEAVDTHLDSLLRDKLDIGNEKQIKQELSKKAADELKRQEAAAAERSQSFLDRTSALKNMINSYDANKREKNPEYLSYEDQCNENEKVSTTDTKNYKKFKEASKEVVDDLDQNFINGLLESADPDKSNCISNQDLLLANKKIEQDAELYLDKMIKSRGLEYSQEHNKLLGDSFYIDKKTGKVYEVNGFSETFIDVTDIIKNNKIK